MGGDGWGRSGAGAKPALGGGGADAAWGAEGAACGLTGAKRGAKGPGAMGGGAGAIGWEGANWRITGGCDGGMGAKAEPGWADWDDCDEVSARGDRHWWHEKLPAGLGNWHLGHVIMLCIARFLFVCWAEPTSASVATGGMPSWY